MDSLLMSNWVSLIGSSLANKSGLEIGPNVGYRASGMSMLDLCLVEHCSTEY